MAHKRYKKRNTIPQQKAKSKRDIITRNEHTKGSEKSAAFFAASDAIRRKTKKNEEARQQRWRAQDTREEDASLSIYTDLTKRDRRFFVQ